MAKLLYSVIMSLDGYVADASGSFDWAAPDDDVHAAVNDLHRRVGMLLLGRRMYEVLLAWENMPAVETQPEVVRDFALIWKGTEKVVYSRTLQSVYSARTRIERDFDVEGVRRMKGAARRDITVGGPELAGQAIRAGLVDEYHLFVVPVIVGGGARALPAGAKAELEMVGESRFRKGAVYLRYEVRP